MTSLLSPGLMRLARSRCVQQSRSPGPAGGGRRGAAGRPPCPQRQADLWLSTCSQPGTSSRCQNRQKKIITTRTVLMCHMLTDEYFIVIPGKAFAGTHETTIMWSCLGTQIKNISNLTVKGKDFYNENIVSQNHETAQTKRAKRCT